MKLLFSILAATVLCSAAPPSAVAREAVSVAFFYDNLEPHGDWREVGDYGYCWQPRHVEPGWRPYSDGRWVYTDAGWTWDSNEPFGWAVYHYGRWANIDRVGWIWVPGTDWGPGWVSWRRSSRHVGWAPLPPEALFLSAFGLSVWVDDYYDIGPGNYRFIESRNFGSRHMGSAFVDQRHNYTIIHQTTNITNITYNGDLVHNGGPAYEEQSRTSSEPIPRYKLERRSDFEGDARHQKSEDLQARVKGDSLSMLALPVAATAATNPRKLAAKVAGPEVNRGWRDAGSPAEVAALRTQLQSSVKAPHALPAARKFAKLEKAPAAPIAPPAAEAPPARTERSAVAAPRNDPSSTNPDSLPPMREKKKQVAADRPPAPAEAARSDSLPARPSTKPPDQPKHDGGEGEKMKGPRRPDTAEPQPKTSPSRTPVPTAENPAAQAGAAPAQLKEAPQKSKIGPRNGKKPE
ncbi:MAG TPA: DUF6600 domain-containing protein [Prosthecobacter sp.]|nr:DUF6600 domain-containing protein [Prosthecobacter sp.]